MTEQTVESTVADVPSTPYPVGGDHPECYNFQEPKYDAEQIANAITAAGGLAGGAFGAIAGGPPAVVASAITAALYASIIGGLLAKPIAILFTKAHANNANCFPAVAVVPAAARILGFQYFVSYHNLPRPHPGWVGVAPDTAVKYGFGVFPSARWDPRVGDAPIPGDKDGHRIIVKRLMNWSDKSELFGYVICHFDI